MTSSSGWRSATSSLPFGISKSWFGVRFANKFQGIRQNKEIISWRTCSRTKSLESGLIVGLNLTRGEGQTERHDLLRTGLVSQNRSWSKLETARDISGIS